ncbi:MAG: TIGR01777 family oxidoreductase [Nevskiales bacterium]|nr:TIGR01777 family oxidoreductase [Nevskiales bacterium]
MHVLITGGSGFVGSALCRALIARGDHVTVLTRDAASTTARRLPPAVTRVESLDALRDPGSPDVVINLAGENLGAGRWTPARKRRMVDSRVDTTRALVEWIGRQRTRPRLLLSASAIGWYGARGDEILDESSPPGGDDEFTVSLCRQWEAAAQAAREYGVNVGCVRIGIVLDRDGGSLARLLPPFRLGLGGPIGSGRQWMSWIHRDDLVALLVALSQRRDVDGAYNATAPQPVTNRRFAQALGRALRRPALLPMPGIVLHALIGEMADILLTGQRVLPHRLGALGFEFAHPDLDHALRSILG